MDDVTFQRLFKKVIAPPIRYGWNVRVEGLENVPSSGAAILAPNHISVLDSFVVPLVLNRPLAYVGKAEYLDDWKTRKLFPALGMIPIDRSGGDASKNALNTARGILEKGRLFGIYPEGTRSRSGQLHKGHTGVARLSLETGAPIVPVGIIGTDRVQPPDTKFPKPFQHVLVRFGTPLCPKAYANRLTEALVPRAMTDDVMEAIQRMTGQVYVSTYASRKPKPQAPTVSTGGSSTDSTSSISEVKVGPSVPSEAAATSPARSSATPDRSGSAASSTAALRVRTLDLPGLEDLGEAVEDRPKSGSVLTMRPLVLD